MEGSGIVLGLSDKNSTTTTNHDLSAKLTSVEKEQSVDQEDGRYQPQECNGRDDIKACEREERGAPSNRSKRSDIGRAEWSRNSGDRRARNDASQQAAKRRKVKNEEDRLPIYALQFAQEEIDNEEKRPKRKVAVMIGYSGTGYKGMQLQVVRNHRERTIEGDLFSAFVAAGAISKANADDPKKSSLVRCARTDKGVHAAGNLISMKLIIEDSDIVQKINENLSPQIRVFGIERTNGSFSAYQFCDSRIYEYLIPTHAFLPPHPDSFLWKKLVELAEDARDSGGFESRQSEVSGFWNQAENQFIDPILEHLDPIGRSAVRKMLYDPDGKNAQKNGRTTGSRDLHNQAISSLGVATGIDINKSTNGNNNLSLASVTVEDTIDKTDNSLIILKDSNISNVDRAERTKVSDLLEKNSVLQSTEQQESQPNLDLTLRKLKSAYVAARKAYRIHPARLARVRSVLSHYVGSKNYHNYTTNKSYRDASAKRIIKSFAVQQEPIIINDTEWLSLKVHGQSFMMHQIRKMVAMAALVVRCGCDEQTLEESYASDKISIPKAPGLGLLLERPVFDSYNERLAGRYARETLDFSKFEKEMEEFKQKEIYERIFREEERDNQFHTFFSSIDNLKTSQFLYLSSLGIPAIKGQNLAQASDVICSDKVIYESSSGEEEAES